MGVIGVGWGSMVQVPAFRAAGGYEVAALCSRRAERAAEAGVRLGIEDVSTDWERFVRRPDLDVISVCTPTDLHREQVLGAISAGKHVLGMNLPRPRDMAPLLVAWIASVGVMVFEKDLGTSLLLYASFLVLVYVATDRISWVLIGLTLFAIGSVAAYQVFAHVQVRVQNWIDPFADPDGAGYQMVQSLFSFATGGIFGTGLGNGQPETVPAASTDFIVAAIGEELGLVGVAGVLMLYTILIIRGLRTAIAVRDSFGKLLAAGLASTLAIQLFIVVGGVTKLIPLTGLTTPWMSYGGSSLLANYVLLAILIQISHAARRPISTKPVNATPIASASTEVIEKV